MKKLFIIIVLLTSFYGCNSIKEKFPFDNLAIEVKDTSRTFVYTNKNDGFYFGKTNSYNNDSSFGWIINGKKILSDYRISLDDKIVDRTKSVVTVYPHLLKREYDDLQEEFFVADSLNLLTVKLKNINASNVGLNISGLTNSKVEFTKNIAIYDLGIILPGNNLFITSDCKVDNLKAETNQLIINTEGKDSVTILFYLSKSSSGIGNVLSSIDKLISKKEKRIEKLLAESFVKTNDEELNKALAWAKISLDGLINNNTIMSGIPYAFSPSGRNSLISLPGTTLVNTDYFNTKRILLYLSALQDKVSGRIPNEIFPNMVKYNSIDATSWFVVQCYKYFYYSGDIDFLKQIYPTIKLACDAQIRKSTDANGFLLHSSSETWMTDKNPLHNIRSVEVQALWYKQLICGSEIGYILHDTLYITKLINTANKLRNNFKKFFVDTTNNMIYNRLEKNGNKDFSQRPNLFFALNEPDLFSNSLLRVKILGNVMQSLVFPYGVLSLSQEDKFFQPSYLNSASLYNGVISQWNDGQVIQTLCGFGQQNTAWSLTDELSNQILERGTIGTLAEFLDALPDETTKDVNLHGNSSTATCLAEYIRNFYQDYLGVKPDAYHKALYLLPTLPDDLKDIEFDQRVGNDKLKIHYSFSDDIYRITISTIYLKDSLDIGAAILNKTDANFQMKTSVKKNDKLVIEVPAHSNTIRDLKVFRNSKRIQVACQIYNEPPANYQLFQNIKFAIPKTDKGSSK